MQKILQAVYLLGVTVSQVKTVLSYEEGSRGYNEVRTYKARFTATVKMKSLLLGYNFRV